MLVADDSRVARALMASHLRSHGCVVVEATDGEEALALALEWSADVVLLDTELPGWDGLDVLDRFKSDPALAHLPIVFVSHRTGTADVVEGLHRGAHDYLRKPLDPAELVARVNAAARQKALQDGLRDSNRELVRTAATDPLTGLYNRRAIRAELDRLLARANRRGTAFGLVLFDVDDFKAINDGHGHVVGDAALCEIARRLGTSSRAEDLLGRWGGDELIVLAPDIDGEGVRRLRNRMRDAVGDSPLSLDGVALSVSITAGGALWRTDDTADVLLRRADAALYDAKGAARTQNA